MNPIMRTPSPAIESNLSFTGTWLLNIRHADPLPLDLSPLKPLIAPLPLLLFPAPPPTSGPPSNRSSVDHTNNPNETRNNNNNNYSDNPNDAIYHPIRIVQSEHTITFSFPELQYKISFPLDGRFYSYRPAYRHPNRLVPIDENHPGVEFIPIRVRASIHPETGDIILEYFMALSNSAIKSATKKSTKKLKEKKHKSSTSEISLSSLLTGKKSPRTEKMNAAYLVILLSLVSPVNLHHSILIYDYSPECEKLSLASILQMQSNGETTQLSPIFRSMIQRVYHREELKEEKEERERERRTEIERRSSRRHTREFSLTVPISLSNDPPSNFMNAANPEDGDYQERSNIDVSYMENEAELSLSDTGSISGSLPQSEDGQMMWLRESDGITHHNLRDTNDDHSLTNDLSNLSTSTPISTPAGSFTPSIRPTTGLLYNTLPPDMCSLTGSWIVDKSKSDSLSTILAALNMPQTARMSMSARLDSVTAIVHDPIQREISISDQSDRDELPALLWTDGVIRTTTSADGKEIVVRRATEELDYHLRALINSSDNIPKRQHKLRGGIVKVETILPDNTGTLVDIRLLVDRCWMFQRTTLIRDGTEIGTCRLWYMRIEPEEEKLAREREWKKKCTIASQMQAEAQTQQEHHDSLGSEWADRSLRADELHDYESSAGENENDVDYEENSSDQEHVYAQTSSSLPPANSNLRVLPPPPSFTGVWQVNRQESDDVIPLLKRMGVSWMDRNMTANMDEVVIHQGTQVLTFIDKSALGSTEMRYVCDGQWHDGMSFGGKDGKVRVTINKSNTVITCETVWIKDKRSRFQQIVDPIAHGQDRLHGDMQNYHPPPGFILCKLIDTRTLEKRTSLRQQLTYMENEGMIVVCIRTLLKNETIEERRKGETEERHRVIFAAERNKWERTMYDEKETDEVSMKTATSHYLPDDVMDNDAASLSNTTHRLEQSHESQVHHRPRLGSYTRKWSGHLQDVHPSRIRSYGPNPLLRLLPIKLLSSGDSQGAIYLFLLMIILVLFSLNYYVHSAVVLAGVAFWLHYLEIMGLSL